MASIGFLFVCVKNSSFSDFALLKNNVVGTIPIRKSDYEEPFVKGSEYFVSFDDTHVTQVSFSDSEGDIHD